MEEIFEIKSCTGAELHCRKWFNPALSEYKAVIQLVHGMEEHIGRYADFAEFLADEGYIVFGHDHLGHGNTAKIKRDFGYFSDKNGWEILCKDIHIYQNAISSLYPDIPYILFGHSMGSLLVRTYVTEYSDKLDGLIISGTSGQKFGLSIAKSQTIIIKALRGDRYRSKYIKNLVTGSFNRKFKPNLTEADWISSDEETVQKYLSDPLCGSTFTVSAYYELITGTQYLSRQKNINKTPNIPILIFSGDKDPVGANGKGVNRVYKMLKKAGVDDVTLKLFHNGRHEMLNEVNKDEVYDLVKRWLWAKLG